MTGPELDALIDRAKEAIRNHDFIHWNLVQKLVDELVMQKAMHVELEGFVLKLVNAVDK